MNTTSERIEDEVARVRLVLEEILAGFQAVDPGIVDTVLHEQVALR